MEKLNTIQTRDKLNDVYAIDEKGNGGANHAYTITKHGSTTGLKDMDMIIFQNGARKEEGSSEGILDTDLLEIVRHRLQCFQAGPYASDYNAEALEHVEIALMYLNKRIEDRAKRNVLGTMNK